MDKKITLFKLILVTLIGFSLVTATHVAATESNMPFLFTCFTALMYWLATSERTVYSNYAWFKMKR